MLPSSGHTFRNTDLPHLGPMADPDVGEVGDQRLSQMDQK